MVFPLLRYDVEMISWWYYIMDSQLVLLLYQWHPLIHLVMGIHGSCILGQVLMHTFGLYIPVWSHWVALQWCHNEQNGVSHHRHLHCLLSRLFRPTSEKTPKLRVTGLCEGNPPVNHRWPVDSPHKGPVTRKMFPFDEVIMRSFAHGPSWLFV